MAARVRVVLVFTLCGYRGFRTAGCPWGFQPATGLALALALCPCAGSGPPCGWFLLFTERVCKHDAYACEILHTWCNARGG